MAVAAYGAFRGLAEVNTHPSLFDVIAPKDRSSSEGLMNLVTFLVGSLSPLALGALSERFGLRGLEIGFACLGGVYVLGALALFVSARLFFDRYRVVE